MCGRDRRYPGSVGPTLHFLYNFMIIFVMGGLQVLVLPDIHGIFG